jgi:hypothetical protein
MMIGSESIARFFAAACELCDYNGDGYRDFIERQLAGNDVVYVVWLDSSKPHNIDYDLLKDQRPAKMQQRMSVVHCASRERAMTIIRMYGDGADAGRP